MAWRDLFNVFSEMWQGRKREVKIKKKRQPFIISVFPHPTHALHTPMTLEIHSIRVWNSKKGLKLETGWSNLLLVLQSTLLKIYKILFKWVICMQFSERHPGSKLKSLNTMMQPEAIVLKLQSRSSDDINSREKKNGKKNIWSKYRMSKLRKSIY